MDQQFYLQITPCMPFLRKRSPDGAFTECGGEHLIAAHYSFIDPKRMEGWVGLCWLTYSGRLTHISGHSSATGWAQDGEKTLARDSTFYRWATRTNRRTQQPPRTAALYTEGLSGKRQATNGAQWLINRTWLDLVSTSTKCIKLLISCPVH